jgi:hypothetical protein
MIRGRCCFSNRIWTPVAVPLCKGTNVLPVSFAFGHRRASCTRSSRQLLLLKADLDSGQDLECSQRSHGTRVQT